jgi:hypothetical protein
VCSPSFRVLYGPSPVKYVPAADVCRGRARRPGTRKVYIVKRPRGRAGCRRPTRQFNQLYARQQTTAVNWIRAHRPGFTRANRAELSDLHFSIASLQLAAAQPGAGCTTRKLKRRPRSKFRLETRGGGWAFVSGLTRRIKLVYGRGMRRPMRESARYCV